MSVEAKMRTTSSPILAPMRMKIINQRLKRDMPLLDL